MQRAFLLDENIDHHVTEFLKSQGFKVKHVPKGIKDSKVVLIAKTNKQIIITHDSDFANTLLYRQHPNYGIIVLRVHPPTANNTITSLKVLFKGFNYKDFFGKTIQLSMAEIILLK